MCSAAAPGGSDQCHVETSCATATPCVDDAGCNPGEFCLEDSNCCEFRLCAQICNACVVGIGEGVCGGFAECEKIAPTLSQWGLIVLGLLLLVAMFLTVRRRSLRGQTTPSLLALMAAGVLAVSVSYAEIQSSRSCADTDLAAELVNDLLG